MSESIWQIIARLRRAQPRNPDTMAVCDEIEQAMAIIRKLEEILANEHTARKVAEAETANLFDRKAWMREYMRAYMRKKRARQKGQTTD